MLSLSCYHTRLQLQVTFLKILFVFREYSHSFAFEPSLKLQYANANVLI